MTTPGGGEAYRELADRMMEGCKRDVLTPMKRGRWQGFKFVEEKRTPLTPAEKQRAYRERIRKDPERYERYLEFERERKRK